MAPAATGTAQSVRAFSTAGIRNCSTILTAQTSNYVLTTHEIGGNTLAGTWSGPSLDGLLSEIQVYGRALTPAEIQGL